MKIDYSRYVISLIITIAIFTTAFYFSYFFSQKKVDNIKSIQDSIAIDVMSTETEFLLKEVSCSNEGASGVVQKLNELGDKLTYTENKLGSDNEQVQYLKKYYSLLQIKDYLLGKKIGDKCGQSKKPIYMIYFYSNVDGVCNDCAKQSAVLYNLRDIYPELRVYTFDYDLDLAPLDTVKKIYKTKAEFPLLVVEDKTYYGLKSVEELKALLPDTLKEATSTAQSKSTSTKSINAK
jgi:hypothetical protein